MILPPKAEERRSPVNVFKVLCVYIYFFFFCEWCVNTSLSLVHLVKKASNRFRISPSQFNILYLNSLLYSVSIEVGNIRKSAVRDLLNEDG